MIYETKGLSLEQVDELFGVCRKAWESHKFRPQVSFMDVNDMNAKSGEEGGRKLSLTEVAEAQSRKQSVPHEETTIEKQ